MLRVGLTGGIGSGKTTVSNLFKALGVPIIDTDLIAQEVVLPGKPGHKMVLDHFGKHILNSDDTLNRKLLRKIVFNDEKQRICLEQILHPFILQTISEELQKITHPYCIIVIPLLIENPKAKEYVDRILVVDCTEEQQIQRTIKRDQISREASLNIINAQASRKERLAMADDVIENNDNINELKTRVKTLHQKYLELARN